jgi:ribonucleoside-triphosphate reductase
LAVGLINFFRETTDKYRTDTKLNFSNFAPAAEYVSGRFCKIDSKNYKNKIFDKNFYTNSFHLNVDSEQTAINKIKLEGRFHSLCNGGCITYVELGEAPMQN